MLTAAVFRFGRLALLYLVGLAILAAIPVWPALDRRAGNALLHAGHRPQLDPNLVPVDLRLRPDADSAVALLAFLDSIRRSGRDALPRAIVVDMFFSNGQLHADRAVFAKLGDAIGAITGRNAKIYIAVNPYGDGVSHEVQERFMDLHPAAVYGRVSGVGHTEWSVLSNEPGAAMLAYRAAIRERSSPANDVYAMPLVLTGDLTEPADREFPFVLGDPASFHAARRTLDQVRADPGQLGGRIVLVGSSGSRDIAYGISGLESVAWALTERLTAATSAHVTLFANPAVELGLTLLLSLFATTVFVLVFRLLRPRRFTVAAAAAAAIVLPLALFLLALHVLASLRVIYLQSTFEVAGVLLASIVCTWAGREQLRRDVLISSYVEGRKVVDRRYDVFVSYSRDDENTAWVEENVVKPLAAARNSEGKPLSIFFDKQTIQQGIAWYESIVDALWGSDTMIPIYTKRYFERPMCTEELLTAMRRAVDDRAFAIRPLSRVAGDIPHRFSGTQYVDVAQNPEFMESLLAAVAAGPPAP
jgi:hypothetical protein